MTEEVRKEQSVTTKTDTVMKLVFKLSAMTSKLDVVLWPAYADDGTGPMYVFNCVANTIGSAVGAIELSINHVGEEKDKLPIKELAQSIGILKLVRKSNGFNSEDLNKSMDDVVTYGEKVIEAIKEHATGDDLSIMNERLMKATIILLNNMFKWSRKRLIAKVENDADLSFMAQELEDIFKEEFIENFENSPEHITLFFNSLIHMQESTDAQRLAYAQLRDMFLREVMKAKR